MQRIGRRWNKVPLQRVGPRSALYQGRVTAAGCTAGSHGSQGFSLGMHQGNTPSSRYAAPTFWMAET